jgi:hypothetical protein
VFTVQLPVTAFTSAECHCESVEGWSSLAQQLVFFEINENAAISVKRVQQAVCEIASDIINCGADLFFSSMSQRLHFFSELLIKGSSAAASTLLQKFSIYFTSEAVQRSIFDEAVFRKTKDSAELRAQLLLTFDGLIKRLCSFSFKAVDQSRGTLLLNRFVYSFF